MPAGHRALVARRLVEAGCSYVTIVFENPYQSGIEFLKQGTYNWDSARGELPHLGRRPRPVPVVRQGRDRAD